MIATRTIQSVLSSFALHLASQFGRSRTSVCSTTPGLLSNGRSSSTHSYRYASSNDRPNCFASYNAQLDPSCNMRASQQTSMDVPMFRSYLKGRSWPVPAIHTAEFHAW